MLGEDGVERLGGILPVAAEEVDHDGVGGQWVRRAEREVEDGAQVLFELARRRPSIVQCPELWGRMASSLTKSSPPPVPATSKSSTASTPVTSSPVAMRSPMAWACAASA